MKGKVKRLTVNRLALASLRARRREYAALAVGIMLAVSLVFTLLFTGSSLLAAKKRPCATWWATRTPWCLTWRTRTSPGCRRR
jgi:hypothetical protein